MEELLLLKILLLKEEYIKYRKYLDSINLEYEPKAILDTIGSYYDEYPDTETISLDELKTYFYMKFPLLKTREAYDILFNNLESLEINNKDLITKTLSNLVERYFASDIIESLTQVLSGSRYGLLPGIEDKLKEFYSVAEQKEEESPFVESTLTELLHEEVLSDGLKWRLPCLNMDIGDLRGGSLGHVYARPDTGKTSFFADQITNFANQLHDDEIVAWFNNEEKGTKVKLRLYSSLLNKTKEEIAADPEGAEAEFKRLGGDRIKIYDSALITISDIELILKQFNVRVLVIDQGDKVKFRGDKDMATHEKLKRVYGIFRELAKEYNCDIITAGQASASGEGAQWLGLDMMDNSKCLAKGTGVVMANGSIKNVEDVVVGDYLIGPDSVPKRVVSTASGIEPMYKIIHGRGKDFYTVNESHILSLKKDSKVVNISVKDYLTWSTTKKLNHKGYKTGLLEFSSPESSLKVDPYFLGVWLGDGATRDTRITTADAEIEEYLTRFNSSLDYNLKITEEVSPTYKTLHLASKKRGQTNPLLDDLRGIGVINNKHIPEIYLTSSASSRLSLLAGLIDTDGWLEHRTYGSYCYCSKLKTLANDVRRLAASLGYSVTLKTRIMEETPYYYLRITGDLSLIPMLISRKKSKYTSTVKDVLKSYINVIPMGIGEYYGFTLEHNGLFVLDNFIVTHNTGKPGELDYAIAIGFNTDEGKEAMRFIHIAKNKMKNGVHGKYIVRFDALRARYSDLNYNQGDTCYVQRTVESVGNHIPVGSNQVGLEVNQEQDSRVY